MQVKCVRTSLLISKLKRTSKTISQVHQVHAHAITAGLFSLHPSLLLSQILHSIPLSPPKNLSLQYPTTIFSRIPNPSAFSYNAIIRVHTLLQSPATAVLYFAHMLAGSVSPDSHSFPFVLKACAMLPDSRLLAEAIHSALIRFGFSRDIFVSNALACAYCRGADVGAAGKVFDENPFRDVVSYNVMVDGFVKNGMIDEARKVFDEMPQRDAVSWGSLLAGYAKFDRCAEAIELFDHMIGTKVRFDNVAVVSVLSACARLGNLVKGKRIHDQVVGNTTRLDVYLGTALVDMYAKCGCIEKAKEVFHSCREKNISLWNAMLVGLAVHGDGPLLLEYFTKMVEDGTKPDGVTMLGVLVGLSHSGLICEARRIFSDMESLYGVTRELKHYGCMADLLARSGLIAEAVEMIKGMPTGGDVFVWGGLLGGCKIHGNLGVAEEAAKRVMELKPEDGGVLSVLACMYANSERWDDLVKVRRLRDCKWGIKKSAGCSLIELSGVTHEFVSGDSLHPQTREIYSVLNGLELHQYTIT